MFNQNYALVKKNKIYEEIWDLLDEEELSMHNIDNNEKIIYLISKMIEKSNIIEISDKFNSQDNLLEDIIEKTTLNSEYNLQGNTILLFSDDKNMYEVLYSEDLTSNIKKDDDLNNFLSISNILLEPIYWDCGVFKSNFEDGIIKGSEITIKDLSYIMIENFYHYGVLINTDGSMIDIRFTGEDPLKSIGNKFVKFNKINIIGFNFLTWVDNESTENNKIVEILYGDIIKGRMFITLLCPQSNKKFWSITKNTINNIIEIMKDKERYNKICKEVDDDNNYNPFFLIKKK